MWIENASTLALLHLLREMDNAQYHKSDSPTPDKVSSAADAMLRLSSSTSPDSATAALLMKPSSLQQFSGLSYAGMVNPSASADAELDLDLDHSPDNENDSSISQQKRKQREFIPENRKDDGYWVKRRKNNEAAKRSREKRRINDLQMSSQISELTKVNTRLQMELHAIKQTYGWPIERQFPHNMEIPASNSKHDYLSNSDSESSNISFISGSVASSTNRLGLMSTAGQGSDLDPNQSGNAATSIRESPGSSRPYSGIQKHLTTPTKLSSPELPSSGSQQMPMLLPLVPPQVQGLVPSAVPARLPHPAIEGSMQYLDDNIPQHPRDSSQPPPPLPLVYQDSGMPYDLQGGYPLPVQPYNSADRGRGSNHSSKSSSSELKINLSVSTSGSDISESETKQPIMSSALNLSTQAATAYLHPTSEHSFHTNLTQAVENSRGSGRKGVPFKLWHKISNSEREIHQDRDSLEQEESAGSMVSSTTSSRTADSSSHNPVADMNQFLDPKYFERRRRNNQAARKCRENRKSLNDVRVQKSSVLESENNRLREEMRGLTTEIGNLRELLEKKKLAQAKGEPFELPPLEDSNTEEAGENKE